MYTKLLTLLLGLTIVLGAPNIPETEHQNNIREQQPYVRQINKVPKEVPKPIKVVPKPVYYPVGDYWDLLKQYDWNPYLAHTIMMCESGGNPNEINSKPPDYSIGLFQINIYGRLAYSRPSEAWLKVPANNIQYAYNLWKGAGGRFGTHWVNCSRKYGIW